MGKNCSCFGHRDVKDTPALRRRVEEVAEELIVRRGVTRFLFGSKSRFDDLCHDVISGLRQKYPQTERVAYCAPSEAAVLEEEREEYERSAREFLHITLHAKGMEEIVEPVWEEGSRAAYIARNRRMVEDSDFCLFYYRTDTLSAGGRSGTAYAYRYAVARGKTIFNVAFPPV